LLLLVALSTAVGCTSCANSEPDRLATRTSAPITFLRGGDIVAVDPHSRDERTLAKLKLPRGQALQGLSWSPDGRRLLYALETPVIECCKYVDVHVMNADGSGHRKIRRTNVYTRTPTWSPRGDKILIDDNDDGGHNALGRQARRERCTETAQRRIRLGSPGVVPGRYADCLLR
jgi:hypothetical protein